MTIEIVQSIAKVSISDVKKSPLGIFEKSEELKQAIYILKGNDVAGVVLSQDIYEQLLKRIEELEEQIFEAEAARRIAIHDAQETPEVYTGEEIGIDLSDVEYDPNDGWE
jgi:vacuolar-type H+-ATPase subunit F/Vma7